MFYNFDQIEQSIYSLSTYIKRGDKLLYGALEIEQSVTRRNTLHTERQ